MKTYKLYATHARTGRTCFLGYVTSEGTEKELLKNIWRVNVLTMDHGVIKTSSFCAFRLENA